MFDADGVEIKVGDKVWLLDGTSGVVIGIDHKVKSVKVDRISNPWILAYGVTHKEPDSLEKLHDDMVEAYNDWQSDPNVLVEFADRLTAIMERDA